MGEVYLAQDTELDRKVALKILPAELGANRERMERFVREAKSAAALNHPNIAHIYEIGESDGLQFIAMEFVDGSTMRDLIHLGDWDLKKLLRYLQHAAEGLAKAHAAGIVHRDLKPENLMVTRDGHAKILDFGLAKLVEPQSEGFEYEASIASEMATALHSTPGIIRGTAGYMAPEQAQGKTRQVDQRSDIFSFGCILYEAATRQRAFVGKESLDSLHRIVYAPTPLIKDINPEAPEDLQRIVGRCLAKDPEERYQTIKEVVIELRALRRQMTDVGFDVNGPQFSDTMAGSSLDSHADEHRTFGVPTSPSQISQTTNSSNAEYVVSEIKRHKLAATLVVLIALAVGIAALTMYLGGRKTGTPIQSIAVLPFANTTGDANTDYLSDGITESLINSISQFSGLRVVPRSTVFRFKGQQLDPQQIGRSLGVSAILTGRVVQQGNTVNIQTELIDVDKNAQLWGQQYNRSLAEVQTVQAEITKQIRDKLGITTVAEGQRANKYSAPPEAYQAYLKGRYYFFQHTEDSHQKAIQSFNEAIALAPDYAQAYAGLATVYTEISSSYVPPTEAMPKAKQAVQKALELDSSLPEAHVALAEVSWWGDWNFAAAEQELKRAIELRPNDPALLIEYGNFLARLGRSDEALAIANRALQLDSASPFVAANLASILYFTRQPDRLIEQGKRMLSADPASNLGHIWLGRGYLLKGMYEQAIPELQRSTEPQSGDGLVQLGYTYAKAGRKSDALRIANELEALAKRRYSSPVRIACIHAALGDKDLAFEWLEKAYAGRSDHLTQLKTDCMFDSLRSDPRFTDLLRRVGLTP